MKNFELLPPDEGDDLAKEINELHSIVKCGHEKTHEILCQSVSAAWKAGQLLLKQKMRVRHGNWGFWLQHHFKASPRTAERYMHLAKSVTDVTNLNGMNIRQAYLYCGISMASSSKEPVLEEGKRRSILPPYLISQDRFLKTLRVLGTPSDLPQDQLIRLRQDLRPLHEWFRSLYGSEIQR